MADTPPPKGLLDKLKTLLPGEPPPHPRWPHRTRRWLDANVHLHAWRNRIDIADAPEAIRVIGERSDGRIDETGVAEILDALMNDEAPASFRFGAPTAYRQIWVGISKEEEPGGVRLFLLSDEQHVKQVEADLSVAGFQHPEKRPEYDRLARFLVAVWEWRGSAAPASVRLGHDANVLGARLQRMVTDPRSPALEMLRGLRRRTRDMVGELAGLTEAEVAALDALLAERGAPTLTQLRASLSP